MNMQELLTYVEELTFKTSMFGYDKDEVDIQLDKICDEAEAIILAKEKEIEELKKESKTALGIAAAATGKTMEELEKDSVVLLEQLRTLDKRRLENYVCTLDRTEMEKINKAIRRSTGIPKIIEKPLVVSLCRVCAGNFYDVPGHYIRRVNPEQRYKDTCMFCNIRKGYDYYIGKKRV